MSNKLKVLGDFNGNKHMEENIFNLKLGEVRYYPQDNPNILMDSVREISPRTLIRIFDTLFHDYIVDVDKENNLVNHIRYENEAIRYVINKAYICIKEAKPDHNGTVVYLHNGYVLIYKERYEKIS